MTEFYSKLLDATVEYGQGYNQMIGAVKEEVTTNYDFSLDKEINVLDYHIHKIIYSLNKNQRIQSMQLIYKNRNTGQLKTLLDTRSSHLKGEKLMEFEFEDFEEIINVFFYLKEDRLAAICIQTNKGKIKYIGNQDKTELIKDESLNIEDKIIFGFGMQAGEKYGVSSIYCYYMNKNKYGIIQYGGLLQLRAKLKVDPDYKKELEAKKDTLNEKQKLILDTCDLAETAFFPIICYIMSY